MQQRLNPITEKESPTRTLKYSKGEWVIVECIETGMVYLQNPPEYSQLIEEFAWEKQFAEERASRAAEEPVISFLSSIIKNVRGSLRKREKIETVSEKQIVQIGRASGKSELTVTDVGCGAGHKLFNIAVGVADRRKIKIKPVGVELSQAQAAEADERLAAVGGFCIHNTAIDGLKGMPENSIDLIILSSFLEHELNPLSLLRACRDKLADGGRIIIKVPNYGSLNRKVRQERWCGFRYPDHVNYFTPATLEMVVRNADLRLRNLNSFPLNDNMWAIVAK